jgi:hypothetical protein
MLLRDLSRLWRMDCGARERHAGTDDQTVTLDTTYAVPQRGRAFSFEAGDTQIFELPVSPFEHRHFYRSELWLSS